VAIIIKTPEQIEGIRKSCQLSAKGLNYLEKLIQPGITTKFLANQLDAS
jgi:methionyl aminopeptidase